jgi:hypothetical protein
VYTSLDNIVITFQVSDGRSAMKIYITNGHRKYGGFGLELFPHLAYNYLSTTKWKIKIQKI